MDPTKEEQIRIRAYQIWEAEGRPEGRHDHHWSQAQTEGGSTAPSHPGMMGDGTEEQNLDQPGQPGARITQGEVEEAFGTDKAPDKGKTPSGR